MPVEPGRQKSIPYGPDLRMIRIRRGRIGRTCRILVGVRLGSACWSFAASKPPALPCQSCSVSAVRNIELPEDAGDMGIDGPRADKERLSDLAIGLAGSQQMEDFTLSPGKPRRRPLGRHGDPIGDAD